MDRLPAALSALHLTILLFSVFLVYSYVSAKTAPAFLYTGKNKKDLSTRILLQISLAVSNKTRLQAMNVDSVTPEAPTTPLCLLLCGFYHFHYLGGDPDFIILPYFSGKSKFFILFLYSAYQPSLSRFCQKGM